MILKNSLIKERVQNGTYKTVTRYQIIYNNNEARVV